MHESDNDSGYIARFKNAAIEDLQKRIDKIIYIKILRMATALDLRFKSLKCMPLHARQDTWGKIESELININIHKKP